VTKQNIRADRVDDARPTVLVVDDERLIRWSLGEALSEAGYQVRDAGDAKEVRRQVRAEERPPDVVLLDLRLPDSEDLELLKTLKEHAPACKVILMTANSTAYTEREARAAGADRFVAKPFDLEEMVRLVTTLLSPAHGDRKAH